ncbi:leucine-rich repeat-containing protein 40-like protein [Acrodontium crateriforme]|uniref:Leucine-rich repeat-containing protein 40-like protein n=1 Tax=Acrodontium crateriforme TaxID=150365 RepID=A0AAQ3RAE6_9PEZI|nr:leucine-rich repeat-containing protein 40-like protein [Acrodontium crateriforme]
MDSSTRKPSGIPRPQSKLPVLRSKPSLALPSRPPAEASATTASTVKSTTVTPRLQKRTSTASLSRLDVPSARPAVTTGRRPISGSVSSTVRGIPSSANRSISRGSQQYPSSAAASVKSYDGDESGDQLGSLSAFRSASRQDFSDDQITDERSPTESEDFPRERKASRPSLSDRAIESLTKVPTTPKDRRRSSFFAPVESPMGPPPRPASSSSRASSQTRPGTSDGTSSLSLSRPVTPAIRGAASAKPPSKISGGFGFTPKGTDKRQVSGGFTARLQNSREHIPASPSAPPVPKPTATSGLSHSRSGMKPLSKTVGARPTRPRPALDSIFAPNPELNPTSTTITSPTKRVMSNSSSALREQIAVAKAAARKEKAKHDSNLSTSTAHDSAYERDFHNDPFNQAPKDEKHILRNRIRTALTDGKLNISAMNLKSLPDEVVKMYDTAEMEQNKVNWAEVVDPTKLIAADNELDDLSADIFPDRSVEEIHQDDDAPNYPFLGLEVLDLHGNLFQTIPMGLRRLERLTSLNLTHNKLENSALDVIVQISSLRDLKLGNNSLSGNLPTSIAQLKQLERLELQENRLLGLPEALRELVCLKVINVASNQLTALPMEAFQQLPLIELDVSRNMLISSLFPLGGVSSHPTLQTLNVANNSLAALTFAETLDLPRIQLLNISNNQLRNLPPVSGWTGLITLAAADNKISDFPEGFTTLQRLRNVNFTSNDFRQLDPEIAYMSGLESLIMAANPLREKKYLTMSVDHIKNDLRTKLEPEADDLADDNGFGNGPDASHGDANAVSSKLTIKSSGVLDLGMKSLDDSIDAELETLFYQTETSSPAPVLKEVHLQSNRLTSIPPALATPYAANTLRILNLSSNPFGAEYLTQKHGLSLPSLRELTLNTCRLQSITPLLDNLSATSLQILDITANRLSGPLPTLRQTFPSLTTLWAKDNKFDGALSAQSLQGLTTVNLANNALDRLEPEIGLLWEEGLRFLEVGGNVFRVPNYRVLEKGTEATLRWLTERLPAGHVGIRGGETRNSTAGAVETTDEEEWFDA